MRRVSEGMQVMMQAAGRLPNAALGHVAVHGPWFNAGEMIVGLGWSSLKGWGRV